MPTIDVFRQYYAIQYTGGNGAEVAAALGMDIVEDTGTALTLSAFGDPIPLNDWVAWVPAVPGMTSPEYWTPLDDPFVYFSRARSLVGHGSAAVSGQALGQANRQFDVDLDKDMGGTSYEVVALVTGGTGHTIDSATALDSNTARVILDSAALSEDATLTVLAIG